MRKSWPEYFAEEARIIADQSTCCSRHVGAVFVRDKHVIAKGFNGVPSGSPHPNVCIRKQQGFKAGEHLHLCACLHAEANGIATAARFGIALDGAECWCTTQPCWQCMGQLATAGIKKIIYIESYPDERSEQIAKAAGIRLYEYELYCLHNTSFRNRAAIKKLSGVADCSCFYCVSYFDSQEIVSWVTEKSKSGIPLSSDDQTALCPLCGIDSVIPSVVDKELLTRMNEHWFGKNC